MRRTIFCLILLFTLPCLAEPDEQALRDDLKQRLQSAFNRPTRGDQAAALKQLFYQGGLDDATRNLLDRSVQRMLNTDRRQIDFAPLSEDHPRAGVLNGYEYRPNLQPLGYVLLGNPEEPPANHLKVLYGLHPQESRFYLPATVRKLVSPGAPEDKQLQMIAVGAGSPPVAFTGWCDVALSDGTIRRVTLDDDGVGNNTRVVHGQKIKQCELERESGHGDLSLRLLENGREIFAKRIEAAAEVIRYPAP